MSARGDLHGRAPAGEERTVEEVDLRRDRERERADREQQAAHAQRADTDEHRDEARDDRAERAVVHGNAIAGQRAVDDAGVVPADVDRHAADKRGGGERAETGERHLPERELTAPTGQHDDRDRAQREREDDRPRLVPLRLVGEQRHDDRDEQREARDRSAAGGAPTRCCLSRSGTAAIRGANWKLSPAACASRLLTRATSTSTTMKSRNCTRPVSVV